MALVGGCVSIEMGKMKTWLFIKFQLQEVMKIFTGLDRHGRRGSKRVYVYFVVVGDGQLNYVEKDYVMIVGGAC